MQNLKNPNECQKLHGEKNRTILNKDKLLVFWLYYFATGTVISNQPAITSIHLSSPPGRVYENWQWHATGWATQDFIDYSNLGGHFDKCIWGPTFLLLPQAPLWLSRALATDLRCADFSLGCSVLEWSRGQAELACSQTGREDFLRRLEPHATDRAESWSPEHW